MIQVSSCVHMNFGRIKELNQAAIKALEQTAEAVHTEVVQAQVMPRDEGTLQGVKTFVDYSESKRGRAVLAFEGPYARRLYYHPEYDFSKAENPHAKGAWMKDWMPGGAKADFAPAAYKKFFKKAGDV